MRFETIDDQLAEPNRGSSDLLKQVEDYIRGGEFELPLLPESSSRLLQLCNDPECDPRELAACIRRDQAVASHLLRVANSSIYSGGMPIVSLQQAIARLGLQRIREIVMVISCRGRVFDVKGYEQDVCDSFRRSLAVAVLSQEIARIGRFNVEESFLSGLLHDVGRPVLLQAIVDLQTKEEQSFPPETVREVVEHFRIEMATALITAWKLPERVCSAVGQQERKSALEGPVDAKILNLAIDVASFLLAHEKDETLEPADDLRSHPMIDQLNIYPDQLAQIFDCRNTVFDLIKTV